MGSSISMIDCLNCGGMGYVDDEYKEGLKITGCDDCKYKLVEKYNPMTQEVYESKESGRTNAP